MLAFAHKPIVFEQGDSGYLAGIDFSKYRMPDGSQVVICVTAPPDGNGSKTPHLQRDNCDACRISNAFLCSTPQKGAGAAPQLASAFETAPETPVIRRAAYPPAAPPHAPPSA